MGFLDDVKKIIFLARKAETLDYPREIDKFRKFLLLIRQLDIRQMYDIRKEEYPPELAITCQKILKMANVILRRIESREVQFQELQDFLQAVISLEQLVLKEGREIEERAYIKPSLGGLAKILKYDPAEARKKGILYRGVSEEDFQKVMSGETLYAADPFGETTLVEHILDPTNNSQTPFISLTENFQIAERFGKVIALSRKGLQGHLFTPTEIDGILRRSSTLWLKAKRLQRKNYEFILGPAKDMPAAIPREAVLL